MSQNSERGSLADRAIESNRSNTAGVLAPPSALYGAKFGEEYRGYRARVRRWL